jgi:hypothetical protein
MKLQTFLAMPTPAGVLKIKLQGCDGFPGFGMTRHLRCTVC